MQETGELLLSFNSYWLTDTKSIADKIYTSDAVIKQGQYLAGIFANPNNTKVCSVSSVEQLAQLTAVSTAKWQTDWQTLSTLPLKQLVREDEWLSQARMVHMQWVDFMLMPLFNTPHGNYQLDKIHLKMVPKLAVLLNDSRNFVISRNHPQGKAAFTALHSGLKQLRSTGKFEPIYTRAGFLADHAEYNILNAPKAIDWRFD